MPCSDAPQLSSAAVDVDEVISMGEDQSMEEDDSGSETFEEIAAINGSEVPESDEIEILYADNSIDYDEDDSYSDENLDDIVLPSEDEEIEHVEPTREDADLIFKKHEMGVRACDFNPKMASMVVTGSTDGKICVWDTSTGDMILENDNHKFAIIKARFSTDGIHVATADSSGIVQIWNIRENSIAHRHMVNNSTPDIEWHREGDILLVAVQFREVQLWSLKKNTYMLLCEASGFTCAMFMPDGNHIAVAYTSGKIRLFSVKSASLVKTLTNGKTYCSPVVCLAIHPNSDMIAAADDDDDIIIYDLNAQLHPLATFKACSGYMSSYSVKRLQFCPVPDLPLLVAGCLPAKLYIWDIDKFQLKHRVFLTHNIINILWDPYSLMIYTSLSNGAVAIVSGRNGSFLQSHLLGHNKVIVDMALSPDGSVLLTASEDKTARVFCLSIPDR